MTGETQLCGLCRAVAAYEADPFAGAEAEIYSLDGDPGDETRREAVRLLREAQRAIEWREDMRAHDLAADALDAIAKLRHGGAA
jgi:hypothetical protein